MKLKCTHCGSENTKFEVIHSSLIKNNIRIYNRISRENIETCSDPVNEISKEYVIVTILCKDCDKSTDIDIFSYDGGVGFKDE